MSARRPLLLRTFAGEQVERPPVWAMRQAGRWDPEFMKLRAGLSFYEFSQRPDLAAEASLLPRRFGVDAIILFYDITTLPVAMGLPFTLQPNVGPVPDLPITSRAQVESLTARPDPQRFGYILEMLERVKKTVQGTLPVLVFAGAPFTVASYCINTGKRLDATRRFAAEQPAVWQALLNKLEEATVYFLQVLVQHQADAYQLFDSWAGGLSHAEYVAWCLPHHERILGAVQSVPSILFVKETPFVNELLQSQATALSLGATHNLAQWRSQHPQRLFQGNVDEALLRQGSVDEVVQATRACLQATGGQKHIVNLNHGLHQTTPPENVSAFVDTVRHWRSNR